MEISKPAPQKFLYITVPLDNLVPKFCLGMPVVKLRFTYAKHLVRTHRRFYRVRRNQFVMSR